VERDDMSNWWYDKWMENMVADPTVSPDTLIILNPRYSLVPSESDPRILEERLDLEATARASVVIKNIGAK
jgi:hypothetical protein